MFVDPLVPLVDGEPVRAGGAKRDWMQFLLSAAVVLTTGAQVVNLWIQMIHPQAAKLPSVILVGLWAADLIRRRALPHLTAVSYMTVGLLLVVLVSGAAHAGDTGITLAVVRWLPFLVTTVVLIDLMSKRVSPACGLVGMAWGATAAASGAIFSFAVLGNPRASGPMDDPNDLAYALTAALPVLLVGVPAIRARSKMLRGVCMIAASLCFLGAAATVSRGGGMAIVVLIAWGFARKLISARAAFTSTVLATIAGSILGVLLWDKISVALDQKLFIASYNVETRTLRWEGALRGLFHSPLWGMGPGGAAAQYGMNSNFAEMDTPQAFTHNMYIEVGADLGLLGIFLFMLIIFATFRHTLEFATSSHPILLACEGSLLAICTSSFFLSEEYYMPLWATISVAAAITSRLQQQRGKHT